MAAFWLTFRIANKTIRGKAYDERRNALYEAVQHNCSKWWLTPTSFIAFESASSIDRLATVCKEAIEPSEDMFLIRMMDTKSAIICGANDDKDIFDLMPYLKVLR